MHVHNKVVRVSCKSNFALNYFALKIQGKYHFVSKYSITVNLVACNYNFIMFNYC